ncbi:unnamed protein product [Jaminaea pallidilutea]
MEPHSHPCHHQHQHQRRLQRELVPLVELNGDDQDDLPSYRDAYQPRRSRLVRFIVVAWPFCLLTVGTSLPLHFYFGMPSTLYLFLTSSLLALPCIVHYKWSRQPVEEKSASFGLPEENSLSRRTKSLWKRWSTERFQNWLAPAALAATALWSILVWSSLLNLLSQACFQLHSPSPAPQWRQPGTVYIAANLYNSAEVLPEFSNSLMDLTSMLGRDNVYVSIYESNSSDDTCKLLEGLRHRLDAAGINNSVRCDTTPGREQLYILQRRIEYLARVRNEALRGLDLFDQVSGSKRLSKVLWLNDIYFDPRDAIELLNTRQGQYDQTCALDMKPLGFYDTWVSRDVSRTRLRPLWPYFDRPDDIESLRRGEPILVDSCWNGMTAFDASWFSTKAQHNLSLPDAGRQKAASWDAKYPIRFRAVPEGACVVSECLLSSFDQHLLLAPERRPNIFINPAVVVAYDRETFWWHQVWSKWWPVKVWSFLWQDIVSYRLFWWVGDWGRKPAWCAANFASGWAPFVPKLAS